MQIKVWNQAPLIRLFLPFLIGIISAIYFPFLFEKALYLISALIVVVAAIVLIPELNISYRRSFWFGCIINSTIFLLAYQLTIYKTEKFSPNHFSKIHDSSHIFYAKLSDSFIEKDRSLKVVLEITSAKVKDKWVSTCGKAMIYLKKDSSSLKLKYGDELLLKADFKEIPAPQNPEEFDYKGFLAFHNVFEQAYVKNGEWLSTRINSGNPVLKYSIGLRNRLLNVLIENHLTGDEFSVGAALLLGYVDKLDADIISAYASTGALHVLSVSGLHVAIVYIVFSWCLFFLDKIRYGPIIKAVLLILFLWFYAALTGLSPSVLRAATMFSFIIIAKTFNRNTNIYNTLAASAFFLLLINPYLIMDVGFQLSYLAVVGIVYIHPKIKNWFQPKNWLFKQIWGITAVSIAAQIATFPLGLHYFHQFPNYFLLSNLVVIPISTVIIYVGISVFSFSKIPLFAKYLSICFTWSIWLLNSSVKWIEKLPYSLIQGIHISVFETWLMYILIILFFCYFTLRKYNYLIYALAGTILILCIQVSEQFHEFNQKEIVVYNIPKTSAVDFITGKNNILLTDSVFAKNESAILFHIKHNWWE
ncbi:MAG: ComEC/Rec2 family competence protein, partial [Bacteroidia bacterium]